VTEAQFLLCCTLALGGSRAFFSPREATKHSVKCLTSCSSSLPTCRFEVTLILLSDVNPCRTWEWRTRIYDLL